MHLSQYAHAEQCVSGLLYRQYMEEKKMLHCNRIVYLFPTKRTVRNALLTLPFASPHQVYIRSFNLSHLLNTELSSFAPVSLLSITRVTDNLRHPLSSHLPYGRDIQVEEKVTEVNFFFL